MVSVIGNGKLKYFGERTHCNKIQIVILQQVGHLKLKVRNKKFQLHHTDHHTGKDMYKGIYVARNKDLESHIYI